MKNWVKGLAVGILAFGLAACSDTADVKPGTDDSKKSELTIKEVFEKAQTASEKIESMHANMDIEMSVSSPGAGLDMDSKIKVDMDMIQDPLAMYQEMDVDMGDEGAMKTTMYMTEEGFFMEDPQSNLWMKLPAEFYDEIMDSTSTGVDPTVDLGALEKYVEDFKFEQNDDQYILTLKASGEKFNELIQEELSSTGLMEDMGEEEAEILESMVIHQLDYEILIDKETFNTTAFNLVMDMEMGEGEEIVRISQNTKAKISRINDIKEISVPQNILDSAIEQ